MSNQQKLISFFLDYYKLQIQFSVMYETYVFSLLCKKILLKYYLEHIFMLLKLAHKKCIYFEFFKTPTDRMVSRISMRTM
jgi:hypothetical protein